MNLALEGLDFNMPSAVATGIDLHDGKGMSLTGVFDPPCKIAFCHFAMESVGVLSGVAKLENVRRL